MKKRAFTLAETLITLMIIGVVAALTIPTLISVVGERQLQTAYKKAMSTIANAAKQMAANETQCVVKDAPSLAACFNKVIPGSLVNYAGVYEENGFNNVILTSDGMAYQFFYDYEDIQKYQNSDNTRTIEEICGDANSFQKYRYSDEKADEVYKYYGHTARCAVLVDLNGFEKGKKELFQYEGPEALSSDIIYFQMPSNRVIDQQAIFVTADMVSPYYGKYYDDNDGGSNVNKGYRWLYGKDSKPFE